MSEGASAASERLAALTDQLVRVPTHATHNARETRERLATCLAVARNYLREHGVDFTEETLPESGHRPLFLARIGPQRPRVLLCGHLDVVPAATYATSRLPGQRSWLCGRGVADMKGPIAALLDIVAHERLTNVGILLTTDEESGGAHGTQHALACMDWRPDVAILPDGGAHMRLVTEQKGMLRLRLHANGSSAHGARPWQGKNALEHLFRGYQRLKRAFPQPRSERDWRVSLTLTQVNDQGNAANVVPQSAEGILDIRYPSSGPQQTTRDALLSALRTSLAGTPITFECGADLLLDVKPFQLDESSPWVAQLQSSAMALRAAPLTLTREAGASDARFLSSEGIPTLVFQPVCQGWHSKDERVSLTSLVEFRALCLHFLQAALLRA